LRICFALCHGNGGIWVFIYFKAWRPPASLPKPKRARRGLGFLGDDGISPILNSGSKDEDDEDSDDGDSGLFDYHALRESSRQYRDNLIEACENESVEEQSVRVPQPKHFHAFMLTTLM
jgi:hypothetical protein